MVRIHIPMPLQIVLDDVGWWSGEDGHERREPFRTGIARHHVPADCTAIVSLGRQLNMRPQAAMIMCEWDRENILRDVPTATWMGTAWDNSRWVGPWLDEAADIIRSGKDHLELTLHGIGHEYWDRDGNPTRAEWHDMEGVMRPRDEVRKHLDYYAKLLDQHDLGPFPNSFVPAAFRHRFGSGPSGIASILREWGIAYMSTPFGCMYKDRETEHALFGIDEGLMTVDRGSYAIPWYDIASTPEKEIVGPVLGLHWPNILHPNPERNEDAVATWVRFLQPYATRPDRMLARDTATCWTQLAYHALTETQTTRNSATLDFERVANLGTVGLRDTFTLKMLTAGPVDINLSGAKIVSSVWSDANTCCALEIRPTPGETQARLTWS